MLWHPIKVLVYLPKGIFGHKEKKEESDGELEARIIVVGYVLRQTDLYHLPDVHLPRDKPLSPCPS